MKKFLFYTFEKDTQGFNRLVQEFNRIRNKNFLKKKFLHFQKRVQNVPKSNDFVPRFLQ